MTDATGARRLGQMPAVVAIQTNRTAYFNVCYVERLFPGPCRLSPIIGLDVARPDNLSDVDLLRRPGS